MGCMKSKKILPPETLSKLVNMTSFTERELQAWFKSFHKECPSGKLGKEDFYNIYKHFFPYGNPAKFSKFLFTVFDQNQDGEIEFEEFVNALSVTSRGTLEAKLKWAFQLYDQDRDGYVTRDEMLNIITSIYSMTHKPIKDTENTPQSRVDKIFLAMDKNADGVLSMEEFVEGCKSEPAVIKVLTSNETPKNSPSGERPKT